MMMGEKEGQKIIQANKCSTQPIPQPTANRHFLHFPGYSLTRPHGFPKLLETRLQHSSQSDDLFSGFK